MGVVALSKFIPSCIEQLSLSVRNAFGAELSINYANGDTNTLFRDLSRAMKMTALIMHNSNCLRCYIWRTFFCIMGTNSRCEIASNIVIFSNFCLYVYKWDTNFV